MAATSIYSSNTKSTAQNPALSSQFTVSPASRVSVTMQGVTDAAVQAVLLRSNGDPLTSNGVSLILSAANNSAELLHAGTYSFAVTNPNGVTVNLFWE